MDEVVKYSCCTSRPQRGAYDQSMANANPRFNPCFNLSGTSGYNISYASVKIRETWFSKEWQDVQDQRRHLKSLPLSDVINHLRTAQSLLNSDSVNF